MNTERHQAAIEALEARLERLLTVENLALASPCVEFKQMARIQHAVSEVLLDWMEAVGPSPLAPGGSAVSE